jgi:hypothetical protein
MKVEPGEPSNAGRLFIKICSDHLSIEAIPRKAAKIDIMGLKGRLVPGHEIVLWAPQFVVLRNREGHEITLRRDGRMIIRKAVSEQVAERAADEVMTVISSLS